MSVIFRFDNVYLMKWIFRGLIALVILILVIEIGIFIRPKNLPSSTQSLSLTFTRAFPGNELVLAKGYYGTELRKEKGSAPIYLEGVVRVGIKLKDLKVEEREGVIYIFYPSPRLLGVDLAHYLDFSEELDEEFHNQVLRSANFYLFQQAGKEGILKEAEIKLRKLLSQLSKVIYPDKPVIISPESKRGKIERE